MKTTIIIPTLHRERMLANYLDSLAQRYELIVIANESAREVALPYTTYLGSNLGFTGACNAGARAATGDFLLFLNDDCTIAVPDIARLESFLTDHPTLAATQPIIRSVTGTIQNIGFTINTHIAKAHPTTELSTINYQLSTDRVYGLSATCLLIRKDTFLKVGMFDESFHSYLEDVDLALRLWKNQYRVAPCLEVTVIHQHMATSSQMGNYKQKRDLLNWWRIIVKHRDLFGRWSSLPGLILERVRNLNGLLKTYL